jgi:hydroxyacylglutathione hydrolase
MIFETVVVGPLGVNCFILGCKETKEGVVVDPGAEPGKISAAIARLGLRIGTVINTHGHFDHVGGNRKVLEETGAQLLIHRGDVHFLSRAADVAVMYGVATENSPPPDRLLEDGMLLSFGPYQIKVLHTPGHTPGGCSLYLAGEGMVITGDTLFADGVGRTDFPGSSHEALIAGIREKLLTLPDETRVYPGHGPATTIGHERRNNPYLFA